MVAVSFLLAVTQKDTETKAGDGSSITTVTSEVVARRLKKYQFPKFGDVQKAKFG